MYPAYIYSARSTKERHLTSSSREWEHARERRGEQGVSIQTLFSHWRESSSCPIIQLLLYQLYVRLIVFILKMHFPNSSIWFDKSWTIITFCCSPHRKYMIHLEFIYSTNGSFKYTRFCFKVTALLIFLSSMPASYFSSCCWPSRTLIFSLPKTVKIPFLFFHEHSFQHILWRSPLGK